MVVIEPSPLILGGGEKICGGFNVEAEKQNDHLSAVLLNTPYRSTSASFFATYPTDIPRLDLTFLQSGEASFASRQTSETSSSDASVSSDEEEECESYEAFQTREFAEMLEESSTLEEVRFARQIVYPNVLEVCFRGEVCTDAMIKAATEGYENLTGFHLKAPPEKTYPDITIETIIEVLRQNSAIQSLTLEGVPNVTIYHVLQIAEFLPDLQSLKLGGFEMTDQLLSLLLGKYQKLSILSLGLCNLTAEGWRALAQRGADFKELYCIPANLDIAPSVFADLFRSLTNIERLSCFGISELDDTCIDVLADNGQKLLECTLGNCRKLSKKAVGKLSTLPKLAQLFLSGVWPGYGEDCAEAYRRQGIEFWVNGIQM